MAVDMFLKIDDIKGESLDFKHKDEIAVISWSWGMTQSGSTHEGSGSGSGKVNIHDLTFTHFIDRASPNLMKFCCNGRHFKHALLTVRKAGGDNQVEYLKIKLSDIIISSVSSGGSHGEDKITENIALNFGKFQLDYTPQKSDGSPDSSVGVAWNIPSNNDQV
jgi:type VI secretion system secreted protein Hcp